LRTSWRPGERGAAEQLDRFLEMGFSQYTENRNRPDLPGTSRLSPHLHFGEISPRRVWHAVRHQAATGCADRKVERPVPGGWLRSQFIAELGWREFAHHLLHHYPHTDSQPLRPEFGHLRWRLRPDWLKAWQKGRTGFPLVDAGMRELWHTGWMHNRVRMVAASFLVKDLLIPWQEGARWFWDTLVDADLAQNTLGWQWTAGCGADAAPFFRVFNPIAQAQKFDPEGVYIRRWIPELREVSGASIQEPHRFAATPHEPESTSGSKYPPPIVSHAVAREVALEAYKRIRS
jgi:deoxyribodipyrimidine photo-lyase